MTVLQTEGMQMVEVEVWVVVHADGAYEVFGKEEEMGFPDNMPSRAVKLKVKVPLPKPVEVEAEVEEEVA